jgi:hypothetical protein
MIHELSEEWIEIQTQPNGTLEIVQKSKLGEGWRVVCHSTLKLERVVDFIKQDTEILNWRMNVIPFDDTDLQELAIWQSVFQFGNEMFEYESRAGELEDNVETLKVWNRKMNDRVQRVSKRENLSKK